MRTLILATLIVATPATAQKPANWFGTWANPSKSVQMQSKPCGKDICGVVVYANEKAKADAAKGGTPNLIGMNLLSGFQRTGPTSWSGKVFVPDINRTVSGTVELTSPRTIEVKGCILGNIACKAQIWTRVK
ncbi:DUF2147 domain-containing protein [Sandaracinobacteroides saxicola]|uniref:DUF2147 domain-containing protein n=1 Tax=Sandaracinobacteroides saxicola TaxID=2759707 RepID=A0A7G5IFY8_9SPHN|nr:DUF2147 domain-containing protein [Sandaracinobacteroides saxicola]QMW22280.1 DUF2147 domain-containing protein [Sandaracinobacteroides saxicola]